MMQEENRVTHKSNEEFKSNMESLIWFAKDTLITVAYISVAAVIVAVAAKVIITIFG